ncbi:hypothetical protein BO78DRAFT_64814 [Aspergillus sclerotiicarbonarius CBS 121057]|uniref:Uncharacterized protein n=1 Tax=Aspergillus sclerotiicarbonarius (strain CBS 121057 / IBT 28362) TaxID=1448318 RepID=A0A319FNN4_ASPSB|nr:hypothetical protein BO78DRAFT_64814 [Aspergillus sclerotiicarbonarius CBS 121057]
MVRLIGFAGIGFMTRDTHVLGERGGGPKLPILFSLQYGTCTIQRSSISSIEMGDSRATSASPSAEVNSIPWKGLVIMDLNPLCDVRPGGNQRADPNGTGAIMMSDIGSPMVCGVHSHHTMGEKKKSLMTWNGLRPGQAHTVYCRTSNIIVSD